MTNEEALSEIQKMVYRNTDNFEIVMSKGCYKTIIKALEKQIPKKPNEGEYKFFPVCPNCDMHLDADDTWVMTRNYEKGEERFCLYCGQALDWNEEM